MRTSLPTSSPSSQRRYVNHPTSIGRLPSLSDTSRYAVSNASDSAGAPTRTPTRVCRAKERARDAKGTPVQRIPPTPFVGLPPDLVPPFRRVCASLRSTTLTTELAALARVWCALRCWPNRALTFAPVERRSRARLAARGRPAAPGAPSPAGHRTRGASR